MGFFQQTRQGMSDFARRYVVEHIRVGTPVVSLYCLDTDSTVYDRARGDFVGDKQYREPVDLHCYIDPQVETQEYDDFGLNESRELEAFFSIDDLIEKGIEVSPGDYIEYDGRKFEVRNVQAEGWYLSDSRPYMLKAWLNIKRGNTLSDEFVKSVGKQREVSEDEMVEMSVPVVVSDTHERIEPRDDEGDIVLY